MIWAKEETLPRSEIEAIQLAKLKETVRYIYDRVKPYRRKMDAAGVRPEDIKTLDDLRRMPFTYKTDFRDNYPDGLFAVDKKEIVRYHASSGTTGKPTVVGYTKNDLDMWLNNVARLACMGGATANDVAPDFIWIRHFYRSSWTSRRPGEDRGVCNSHVIRKYKQADNVSSGYGCNSAGCYAVLCAASGRGGKEERD